MKLICLNTWGGKIFEPLMDFIKSRSADTDIFCFQEIFDCPRGIIESHGIRTNLLFEIAENLPEFNYYFEPVQRGFDIFGRTDEDILLGKAIFINKKYKIEADGQIFTYREKDKAESLETLPSSFQYTRLVENSRRMTVINFHGIAHPGDKLDRPERLEQSRRLKEFLGREPGPKILCGDFNLMPETESLKTLEDTGLVNLIKTWNIPETRSKILKYYGTSQYQPFADYAFVSPDVKVKKFEALPVEVSDHLPLWLEFE